METADCSSSPILLAHFLLVVHCGGSSLVRHRRDVLVGSGWTTSKKEGMSILDYLKDLMAALSWSLGFDFTMESSGSYEVSGIREE